MPGGQLILSTTLFVLIQDHGACPGGALQEEEDKRECPHPEQRQGGEEGGREEENTSLQAGRQADK